ncbi:MAG: PAS domain-containing protein [Treponema sp.]|nr:PAS domain-containing protein [Treponema sp.]
MKTAPLTLKDKEILEALKPVADGIALLFGEHCEVVLHSFESLERAVIHIANGHITGRAPGSPITDLGMKILRSSEAREDITGCYLSKTADGKCLRSVTVLVRNKVKKPIGMLCINFNMSAPFIDLFRHFSASEIQANQGENFVTNLEDLIKTTLRETIDGINSRNRIPNHEKNKTIVCELIKKGIFDIRGAIDIVARELSLSRYTIYNYIREHKFSTKKVSA